MNIFRSLFKQPEPEQPKNEPEAERQKRLAREKRERKAAKTRKLVESGQLQLNGQPQYVPWSKAAKDLGLEKVGADLGETDRATNSEELYEPARLEEKQ